MIKQLFCARKKQGISAAEFARYWTGKHAALMDELLPALGAFTCRHSVQIRYEDEPIDYGLMAQDLRGSQLPYDGITEIIWKDEGHMKNALDSIKGKIALTRLIDSERRVCDLDSCTVTVLDND